MPYVALGRIKHAIDSLQRFHAFYGVTFLSMLQSGVAVGTPKPWGSAQENELLTKYYTPPGAPSGKPYCVPLGKPDPDSGFWKNEKYSGGTLQRARTTDNFKAALQHPTRDTWAFVANYLEVLEALLPKEKTHPVRIPVFDLVAWMYRDVDLPSRLKDVEKRFKTEFNIDDATYKKLFDAGTEDPAQFYFDERAPSDELVQLIGGVPDGPSLAGRSESELVSFLETYVTQAKLLTLPPGFVRAFYCALKTQRFVVLAGRPGTGKTAFARAVAEALGKFFSGAMKELVISIGPDFGESDVLGYEKIAGDLAATDLTRQLFLSGRPRDLYFVILDEMNLAHVDHYLARLLPAFESDAPVELPGMKERFDLPPDTFLVGTVNSFVEESTRLPLSAPVKRRANVIEMPNVLAGIIEGGDVAEFAATLRNLIAQTRERCKKRKDEGRASVLDDFRLAKLDAALAAGSTVQSATFVDVVLSVCKACAADPATALTLGVLQDVIDYAAMADDPMEALDRQVAQKIVPQLAGPKAVAQGLLAVVEGLINPVFTQAKQALNQMLASADPSSGTVYFRY